MHRFAGTIPAAWTKLTSLEYLYVKPGNLKLCGPLPEGMQFKVRAWGPCQGCRAYRRLTPPR